jgi:hypothetical protein
MANVGAVGSNENLGAVLTGWMGGAGLVEVKLNIEGVAGLGATIAEDSRETRPLTVVLSETWIPARPLTMSVNVAVPFLAVMSIQRRVKGASLLSTGDISPALHGNVCTDH